MGTKEINLKLFCDKSDGRYKLSAPFVKHGRTVATDGRIIVVLDDDAGQDSEDGRYPDWQSVVISRDFIDSFSESLPFEDSEREISEPCDKCKSLGYLEETREFKQVQCDECRGNREVDCHECGQRTKCKACDGDGEIKYCIVTRCPDCNGQSCLSRMAVKVSGAHFDPKYIDKIRSLPAPVAMKLTGTDKILFTFNGGRGVLMAMAETP